MPGSVSTIFCSGRLKFEPRPIQKRAVFRLDDQIINPALGGSPPTGVSYSQT